MFFVFFFFKQKTAYEMRISDWSSDVCSSDLPPAGGEATCLRRRKPLLFGDIAVMLDAGGTQPRHADAVEHALPCRQFLGTHAISLTRLAGREQAAIDGGDHLRLAPAHPPRRIGRRQIVQRDRKSKRLNSSHYCESRMPSSA